MVKYVRPSTTNNEESFKYRGTRRYIKNNLFTKVGMDKNNPYKYEITKYFYTALNIPSKIEKVNESNWIRFVGVATDEGKVAFGRKDILISWRGTETITEFYDDSNRSLVQPTKILAENMDNIIVDGGFYSIYNSLNEALDFNRITSTGDQVQINFFLFFEEVTRLLKLYNKEEVSITVTGHSLGASLATLCAVDTVVNQINKEFPVTTFVFVCH
ncbi:putative phospholipase A1-II 1-like [Capsicum annuum]|uniref:Phospholipase A1 n=1 Tax=Capsicum annuum TaxID=4072 RepID=A0A2G2ZXE3_CAPAN|nr:putative phospholipase A1-II 1-like [Capsicum annuum]KAF3638938.1 putative phospholipase A1-II 1-like [Capsicum annuum]PHT86657.1 hypothetical protein T459_08763 [Capsicum annuum]